MAGVNSGGSGGEIFHNTAILNNYDEGQWRTTGGGAEGALPPKRLLGAGSAPHPPP